jgi:hypothetical protein
MRAFISKKSRVPCVFSPKATTRASPTKSGRNARSSLDRRWSVSLKGRTVRCSHVVASSEMVDPGSRTSTRRSEHAAVAEATAQTASITRRGRSWRCVCRRCEPITCLGRLLAAALVLTRHASPWRWSFTIPPSTDVG